MFSVMQQEKTALRDSRGMSVYRRLYLCDTAEDVSELPVSDAPGSGALVAEGGTLYLLDHGGRWREASAMVGMGGFVWKN